MKNKTKSHKQKLDHEEKELLASFKNGEWKTVKDLEKEKEVARKAASKTLQKYAAVKTFGEFQASLLKTSIGFPAEGHKGPKGPKGQGDYLSLWSFWSLMSLCWENKTVSKF